MATYYQIIDISQNASQDDIKKAFRKKAKRLHPDVNKSKGAKEKFQQLNEAYQVLTDPNKRRLYDIRLRHGIVVKKVYYRPASTRPASPVYKEREARYAQRESESSSPYEKIVDRVLFIVLLIIGLYGIGFGIYRVFINPPDNDDINPVHGLVLGLVFTTLLLFLNLFLKQGKKK